MGSARGRSGCRNCLQRIGGLVIRTARQACGRRSLVGWHVLANKCTDFAENVQKFVVSEPAVHAALNGNHLICPVLIVDVAQW